MLLLVDAQEGPKPQTRFVLKKALALGLQVLVVVNKIDKPAARCEYVIDKTFDLFCELGASDEQTDFPIVYTSAINRVAGDAACSGWPGLARPRSQQPTRPSTAPEVPHAGAGLPPWALRGAPSPIWVPRSRLRRRSGALPKVADPTAFGRPSHRLRPLRRRARPGDQGPGPSLP